VIELVIFIVGASALAACMGGTLYIYERVQRRTFQENERLLALWARLAAASDQLEFVPSLYKRTQGQNSYLTGTYRGHQIKLDTFYRSQTNDASTSLTYLLKPNLSPDWFSSRETHIYTRLVLTINPNHRLASETVEPPLSRKEIINLLTTPALTSSKSSIQTRAEGWELYYEQQDIETDISYLQEVLDALSERAETHLKILQMGSEVILHLREIVEIATNANMRTTSQELIRGIATKNRQELGAQVARLLCPHCLTRFRAYEAELSWLEKVTYHGCRSCGQSRKQLSGQVVAVLDERMAREVFEQRGVLYLNWLARRNLFDFDAVTIAQASDEMVERFAVQVGNDTDPTRRPRYNHMPCRVSAKANLSENTVRILHRTFGAVTVE